jgi:hypothetical protein
VVTSAIAHPTHIDASNGRFTGCGPELRRRSPLLEHVDTPLARVHAREELFVPQSTLLERREDRAHARVQQIERSDGRNRVAIERLEPRVVPT